MILYCTQEQLSKGLSIVSRAVPGNKPLMPILTNVLLQADETGLKLTATNLEMAITCQVQADVEEAGTVTLPAKLFSEVVNSLPKGNLALRLNEQTWTLSIKAAKHQASIRGMDANDYPNVPIIGSECLCQLKGKALQDAISSVVFAAAIESTRPVLNGVQAAFNGESLTLTCGDGYRLATTSLHLPESMAEAVAIVVPSKAMAEVAKIAGEADTVRLALEKGHITFGMGSVELTSQLIEGRFPDFKQILSANETMRVVVDVDEFAKAVRLASYFTDSDKDKRVKVTVGTDDAMRVQPLSKQTGEAVTDIGVTLQGEPGEFIFNSKQVLDALGVASGGQVSVAVNGEVSPALMRQVGSDTWLTVLMPMAKK